MQGRTLSVSLRRQLFPFLSPGGDIFPRPGEVFPLRWSPWQGREVSALYRSAGEGDTFRLRQSLSLSGEVARPKAVTERVCFPDEPSQSRCVRQLSRRGEPLAKAAGPSPQVNALHPSTYNQYTFPLCQSLSLSGEVARPKAVTERVCLQGRTLSVSLRSPAPPKGWSLWQRRQALHL